MNCSTSVQKMMRDEKTPEAEALAKKSPSANPTTSAKMSLRFGRSRRFLASAKIVWTVSNVGLCDGHSEAQSKLKLRCRFASPIVFCIAKIYTIRILIIFDKYEEVLSAKSLCKVL